MNLFLFPYEVWDKRSHELVDLVRAPNLGSAWRVAGRICLERHVTDDPRDIHVCICDALIENPGGPS